jgi:hypothetical protein
MTNYFSKLCPEKLLKEPVLERFDPWFVEKREISDKNRGLYH